MAFNPFKKLYDKFNYENWDTNTNIENPYDNGSIWTKEEEYSKYSSPLSNLVSKGEGSSIVDMVRNASVSPVNEDPLQAPRNQVKYFTNQLEGMGQEVEKPNFWSKAGKFVGEVANTSGGKMALNLLTRLGAVPSAIENTVAGGINENLKQRGERFENLTSRPEIKELERSGYELVNAGGIYSFAPKKGVEQTISSKEAEKLLTQAQNNTGDISVTKELSNTVKTIGAGIKSGANTLTGLFTGEYSEKAVDWGRVLDENRLNKDMSVKNFVDAIEAPGYLAGKHLLRMDEEQAKNMGNIVADFGLSALSGNFLDIDGAGKTIKYLRNTDKLKGIDNIANMEDALKMANKHNTFDDYVKSLGDKANKYDEAKLTEMFNNSQELYAKELIRDVNKGLGGINDFDGLKVGAFGTVSKDTLNKISTNKVQNTLTQIGLGLYSPVGALMNNPVVDKLGEIVNKTETGQVVKKDLKNGFFGGKDNEWINAMESNPERALEYANERKQVDLAKKLGAKRIQETLEEVNKYSNIKDNLEDITHIIETPKDIEVRKIEVEKEVVSNEYLNKMFSLAKSDLNKQSNAILTMQNRLKAQKEDLLKTSKNMQENDLKVKVIDSEIQNLQTRLDKVNEIASAKSLDFNKQMKQFGYEGEYSNLFDKSIKSDIETLTKEVGDRDLAEALQESANRVLDEIDRKHPGLSDYYSGYGTINTDKVFGNIKDLFENQKEAIEFEKLSTKEKVDVARDKLNEYLAKDDVARNNNDLKAIENNKTQIKSYKIVLEREQKNLIKEKIKEIGIKTDSDKIEAYNEMIENFNMTDADDFLKMLENKEKYINESKTKSVNLKNVREYLGTEGKDLITDLEDIAKKRFKEGGNSPSLSHSKSYKMYKKLNKSTKLTKLDDFEVTNIVADGKKLNTASDKEIKSIAKQMSAKDTRRDGTYLYDNTIDKELKTTLRLIRDLTTDDVTSYLMKKEANKVAKEFVKETGLDISYKEVADRIKLLSYKEMKQEFIAIAKDVKTKIDNEYVDIAKKLTDDEIELYKAQKSAYRLSPLEVEVELKKHLKGKMSDEEINSMFGTKKERALFKESQRKERIRKEMAKEEMDIKEKSKSKEYYEEGDVSLTLDGRSRDGWIDDFEEERRNKGKTTGYDGTSSEIELSKEAQEVKDRVERINKEIQLKREKEKELKRDNDKKQSELEKKYQEDLKAYREQNTTGVDKLLDKVEKANVEPVKDDIKPIKPKENTPISNIAKKDVPREFRNVTGIKFDTPTGNILIDKNISMGDLKKVLSPKKYGKSETGSRVVYTNEPFDDAKTFGMYNRDTDVVIVNIGNIDKNTARTILEHEFGHRVAGKMMKQIPDFDLRDLGIPFLKHFRGLDDKKKLGIIDVVSKANKVNVPTEQMVNLGLITKYLNKVTKEGDLYKISNEAFAEIHSLYNNTNPRIAKQMRELDGSAYHSFMAKMDSIEGEELKKVSKLVRKRFGDDYANKIHQLKAERKAYSNISDLISKASDINKTQKSLDELKDGFDELKKALDTQSFDDDGNYIDADYSKMIETVKKNNPEYVKDIESKIPMYEKVKRIEDKLFEMDNAERLSKEGQELIEVFKNEMRDIAIREGIYEPKDAENFATYVAHDVIPEYKAEAEVLEKGKSLINELSLTENVHAIHRTKDGTIKQLNQESYSKIGKKIYEENILRLMLKRRMESEQTVFRMGQQNRILEDFGIPVIQDFNKEINSFDHIFKYYGDNLKENTGLTKRELKKLYKSSGKTSLDFMTDFIIEDFHKIYKNATPEEVNNSLSKYGIEDLNKLLSESEINDIDLALKDIIKKELTYTNPTKFVRDLNLKYGFRNKKIGSTDSIPYATDDGRKYVEVAGKEEIPDIDKTKEFPYMLEGKQRVYDNPFKDYSDGIYKQLKERDMIVVEVDRKPPTKKNVRMISDDDFAESIKDRTKLSEKISELMKGDKEALDGFDVLAGYNVLDPKKIKVEELQLDNGKRKFAIDRQAWDNYQKSLEKQKFKEKNTALKIFDKVNQMFKSQALFSIGFHERNAITNVVTSYVKSGINLLNPKKNKEAIDILRYKNPEYKGKDIAKKYNGYNVDEILREAELSGLFETQFKNEFDTDKTKSFINRETDKIETKKTPISKMINPFSTSFKGYEVSQKFGDTVESQAKMVNLLTHLDNGMSLSDAINLTKETLFDYSDLTDFETKYMKRFMPFYTFMRKNIPSQIDNLANHGARLNRVEGVYQKASEKNETEKDRVLRPDYLDGQLALGNNKYANLGNPSQDVGKIFNPKDMSSGINPLIRTPIELLFNKKLFSDANISKYDKPKEKIDYMIDSNVPVVKQISALHKLVTGKDEDGKAGKTIKKALGDITNSYDTAKEEKATMYKYVEQLQNQYYEYLEQNPNAKKELEEKKEKGKTNYKSPLSRLLK